MFVGLLLLAWLFTQLLKPEGLRRGNPLYLIKFVSWLKGCPWHISSQALFEVAVAHTLYTSLVKYRELDFQTYFSSQLGSTSQQVSWSVVDRLIINWNVMHLCRPIYLYLSFLYFSEQWNYSGFIFFPSKLWSYCAIVWFIIGFRKHNLSSCLPQMRYNYII